MEGQANCANCLHASVKTDQTPCGECLMEEMETKPLFVKWEARNDQ